MTAIHGDDKALRFLFEEHDVRGVWVRLDSVLATICQQQRCSGPAAELLGESLVAAVLLSRTIKLEGRLALQARGEGPLRLLVAESTADAGVRGVIELDATALGDTLPPISGLVGSGSLAVTLLPESGESYQGIVPLQGERLQDCLADYFQRSEQLPTLLWLACDGHHAAGLMLQALPAAGVVRDSWEHLQALAATVTAQELLSLPAESLLHRLFHQETVRLFEQEPVRFQCTCSVQRSRRALAVLGRDELQKLFAETPRVDVDCQFCGAHYTYVAADMVDVLGEPSTRIH